MKTMHAQICKLRIVLGRILLSLRLALITNFHLESYQRQSLHAMLSADGRSTVGKPPTAFTKSEDLWVNSSNITDTQL
jgi:hypothetical protein